MKATALLLAVLLYSPSQPAPQSAKTPQAPAVVLLMRHAEKPEGDNKISDLAPQGFKRAQALPTLFLSQTSLFPRPDALFATDTTNHSNRPIETITPLSQALHLPINHDYADHDTTPLANKLLSGQYAGKVVVVCWHHGELPHLAQALGIQNPPTWQDTTYDRVWEIHWLNGKANLTVTPEHLLPGDPVM